MHLSVIIEVVYGGLAGELVWIKKGLKVTSVEYALYDELV